jgi:hypothetical protein
MPNTLFDATKSRWWGGALLTVLIWHASVMVMHSHADYLLFVCYAANLFLGVGLLARRPTLVGAGLVWIAVGTPLWLYEAITFSDWELSCTVFHLYALAVGAMTVGRWRLPRHTWVVGVATGAALWLLSRLFTDPALNVNAAFRVYQGWEALFPDYRAYVAVMALGFGALFWALTRLNNRLVDARTSWCAVESDKR